MELGTVLFRLELPFRAVPWKASEVTKHGTHRLKRLRQWQNTVAQYARLQWGNREPYGGPVTIWCRFTFAKGPLPDAVNLLKAVEDALQGIVIINDRQSVNPTVERPEGFTVDMTTIEVRTM